MEIFAGFIAECLDALSPSDKPLFRMKNSYQVERVKPIIIVNEDICGIVNPINTYL